MLAQLRLALTKTLIPLGAQSTRGARGRSELAVETVGLAQQDQRDGGGNNNDHTSPNEAAQEVGEGGGHGVAAVCIKAALILRSDVGFLR